MSKVLLVEDDPFIIRLYQKVLTHEGYSAELADNGLAALEILPIFKPDIILLDIMMPTMNGIEFLKKMHENPETKNVPVLVLTNVADSEVTLDAVNAGAALILIKSKTEPDDVVTAIKRVLAREILQGETLETVDPQQDQ